MQAEVLVQFFLYFLQFLLYFGLELRNFQTFLLLVGWLVWRTAVHFHPE